MSPVAIVTDSAADLPSDLAAEAGITVVPLITIVGDQEFRTGIDLSAEQFYERLAAPGAPFPRTAAAPPATFQTTFEHLLAIGASGVVCVTIGSKLSATITSARIAAQVVGERCRIVDSETASLSVGTLALMAAESARKGASVEEIVELLERRKRDSRLYVVLETLEYLRRGGRIGAAQAAIGSVLSVKPIITVRDGVVETADRPRTRGRARERLIELLSARPVERVAVIHARAQDVEAFADELARATGIPRAAVTISMIGPSVGAHVGPGAYGAAVMLRHA
jgi:DegV family protein with EDD domain